MKYSKTDKIPFSCCNSNADLSLLGATKLTQDACCYALEVVGTSNAILRKNYNAMWVITKNRIKFFKNIAWADEFKIESFISGISKITIMVDTLIKNKNDEIVVYSKSELCAVDLTTRRIRKIETVGLSLDLDVDTPLLDLGGYSQFDKTDLNEICDFIVPSTSIDYSKHMNNTEYVRHIMNTYSVEKLSSHIIKDFEIWYVKESKENDKLTIKKMTENNTDYFIIQRNDEIITKLKLSYEKF